MFLIRIIPIFLSVMAVFLAIWVHNTEPNIIIECLLIFVVVKEIDTYKKMRNNSIFYG